MPSLPIAEMLLAAVVLVADCIAFRLTRTPDGIALLWPGCAIAACVLIRLPKVRWGSAVAALLVAVCLANIVATQRTWAMALEFSALNLAEVALMVAAFRFGRAYPYPDINVTEAAIMTAVGGIAVPGLSAIGGGWIFHHFYGASLQRWTLQCWSSHAIGACLLGPPLILASADRFRRLVGRPHVLANAVTSVLCLAGTYLMIRYVRFPFVTVGLLLLMASFRLGGFGTALLSLAVGLLISNLWIFGVRPVGLEHAPMTGTLVDLPIVAFLATLMPPITVGIGTDARRAVSRALKASERRFRESMAHSPIGMLIADLNGVWTYTNRALQNMLGYTDAEFRALPPGGPSASEDWKASEARWQRLLSGEISSYEIERRFQHKDGHWIWAHVAVSLLRDENDRPSHLIAQIESLEARRLAEANLAAERERLKVTLQAIGDAVITTGLDLKVQYINPAAEQLLGIPARAVLERRIDEVMHLVDPDTLRTAPNLIARSSVHQSSLRRERPCLLHKSDGTVCYVVDAISPVLDATGQATAFVIVLHDATLEVDRSRHLEARATHDPLTGLHNRAELEIRLRKSFERAKHLGHAAALLVIDLDRFKAVNDTGGHATGDEMLKQVAQVCRMHVRASDIVARLGGDEFAIILDSCPRERAEQISQRLLTMLNPLVLEKGGVSYSIGASIGIAMVNECMSGYGEWLEAADAACYRAKRAGRGQMQVA